MSTPTRPAGVTLVMVLTYLSGILDVLAGVLMVATRNDLSTQRDSGLSGETLLTVGIVMLLVGAFVILLAGALGRGSGGARLIVTAVMAVRLGFGIWGAIAIHSATRWSSAVEAVLAAIVLGLLWSSAASTWFASTKH